MRADSKLVAKTGRSQQSFSSQESYALITNIATLWCKKMEVFESIWEMRVGTLCKYKQSNLT